MALFSGYESVGRSKGGVLLRVCRAYLAKLKARLKSFRLHVVEVENEAGQIIAALQFENVPLFRKETFRVI